MQRQGNEQAKQRINKTLDSLSPFYQFVVLLYVLRVLLSTWILKNINLLRPSRAIWIFTVLQILLFVVSAFFGRIIFSIIGSFLLAGMALVPAIVQKPRYKAHWITKGR